jgi:hypothetical protein
MIQLTQLASDNFNRANENPLSQGGKWSVNFAADPLQIVSNACEVATLSASCVETYTGQALPNDQFTSITIKSLIAGNFPQAQIFARSNGGVLFSTLTAYQLLLSISSSALFLYAWVNGTRTAIISSFPITISAGDVWTLVPIGTTIYIFQNGTQVTSTTDTTVTSGFGGIGAAAFTGAGDIVLSTFSVGSAAFVYSISGNAAVAGATVSYSGASSGSVTADGSGNFTLSGLVNGGYTITPSLAGYAFSPTSQAETISGANITGVNFMAAQSYYSEPDCRLSPNASRSINGTLIYDVQTSSNPAIPPTDDRESGAPVACGEYPQNSRAPGKYGAGEN